MDFGSTILALLACLQVTYSQTVTVTGPTAVEQGSNTEYTCTLTGDVQSPTFVWRDESLDPAVIIFVNEGTIENNPKHDNFAASVNGATSTMTITNTVIEDEGVYRCSVESIDDEKSLAVEDGYTLSLNVTNPVVNGSTYEATCDALNGRPYLPIRWMLGDNDSPCVESVDTPLQPDEPGLFSNRSVCTFLVNTPNNEETLRCIISGHDVAGLDRENTATLVIHSAPRTGIITVRFELQDPNLRVTCDIAAADQPNPSITNYYIISNDTEIHQPEAGDNFVDVAKPNFATDFLCVAGNYLGNTTSELTYDPSRPTTPPPTTAPITSPRPNDGNGTAGFSETTVLGAGAIAGIVIGAILFVVIIVVIIYFVLIKGKDRTDGGVSAKKHGSSTVGTSNGSEKDKIKPVAAPRDQGSIQHTTDNPGQQEYAMVDRKKPPAGGDMPDTRGPGQESPGMHYADLDLSTNAGHTERQVPQNPDNVVVYSSILV